MAKHCLLWKSLLCLMPFCNVVWYMYYNVQNIKVYLIPLKPQHYSVTWCPWWHDWSIMSVWWYDCPHTTQQYSVTWPDIEGWVSDLPLCVQLPWSRSTGVDNIINTRIIQTFSTFRPTTGPLLMILTLV